MKVDRGQCMQKGYSYSQGALILAGQQEPGLRDFPEQDDYREIGSYGRLRCNVLH